MQQSIHIFLYGDYENMDMEIMEIIIKVGFENNRTDRQTDRLIKFGWASYLTNVNGARYKTGQQLLPEIVGSPILLRLK